MKTEKTKTLLCGDIEVSVIQGFTGGDDTVIVSNKHVVYELRINKKRLQLLKHQYLNGSVHKFPCTVTVEKKK